MNIAATTVRDVMRWMNDYLLWAVGAAIAILSLFLLIRQNWPRAAAVIAWPVRGVVWCCTTVVFRWPRWFWRQWWRDQHGVTRGPLRRLSDWRRRYHETIVTNATAPQFAETRAAAKAQHDEQNARFDRFDEKIEKIEKHQADGIGRRLESIEGRVRQVEDLITQPSTPAARPKRQGEG